MIGILRLPSRCGLASTHSSCARRRYSTALSNWRVQLSLEDATWAAYESNLERASAFLQPTVKHCYGGPVPFGMGPGLIKSLENIAWLQPLPDPKKRERRERKAINQKLLLLKRNFHAPLDGLDNETKLQVEEGRLRFLLGKFWGLMHEKDRPWHYETILHLCCRLPKPARRLYRKLKPSTLQRILSRRAQAEKNIIHSIYDTRNMSSKLRSWEYKVLERGEVLPVSVLQEASNHLLSIQSSLTVNLASLLRLRMQAKQLLDGDYFLYGKELEDLALECKEACEDLRKKNLSYILRAHSINQDFESRFQGRGSSSAEKQRLKSIYSLGELPSRVLLPSDENIVWRYPPRG